MSHKKAMASRKKAKVDDAGVVVSNAPVARVVYIIHPRVVHGGNDEYEAALSLSQSQLRLRLRKPNNASSFSTSLPCMVLMVGIPSK